MRDETLVEPFAAVEYFVDGFSDHHVAEGVLTCSAYRLQESTKPGAEPHKVVQFKVVMRLTAAVESNQRTLQALQHAEPALIIPFEQKRG